MLIKRTIRKLQSYDIGLVWWILVLLVALLLCSTHIYNDILIVGKGSHDLWDYFFAGRFFDFYSRKGVQPGVYYTVEQRGVYPIVIQIVLSVWLFPVWIIGKIVGSSIYNTLGSMLWLKLFLLLSYILSIYKVYVIVRYIKDDEQEANRASFFFASSVLVFLNTFDVSQVEIFTILLMLCGIDAWIKDSQKKFVLFFALAVGIKYFALIAFFPLLLIKEKKIIKIGVSAAVVSIPMLEALFKQSGGGGNAVSMGSRFADPIFSIGPSVFSPFIFSVLVVLVLCYVCSEEDKYILIKKAFLYEMIIWGAFCFFVNVNPYWSVLVTPFFTIGVSLINNKRNVVVFFESVMCWTLSYLHISKWYTIYDARLLLEMKIIPGIMENMGCEIYNKNIDTSFAPLYLFQHFGLGGELSSIFSLAYNVSLVAWIAQVFLLWKSIKKDDVLKCNGVMYIVRAIVSIFIGFIPMVSFAGYIIYINNY